MRVLVTGASGAVGPRVIQTFFKAGFQVKTYSLDPFECVDIPEKVECIIGNILDLEALMRATEGVDIVVHMASLLHMNNPSAEMIRQIERVNISGTSNVVKACLESQVKRVVLFSSISVYGNDIAQEVCEATSTAPGNLYARTKLEAEKMILSARAENGTAIGTVLRLAAVYGSRVKGNYRTLVEAIARGRFIQIGAGRNLRTLIYDRDVGQAALLAAIHPKAPGQIFNVTDGHPCAMSEIVNTISRILRKKTLTMEIPIIPILVLVRFIDKISSLLHLKAHGYELMIRKYFEESNVSGKKIQVDLGFRPEYDLVRGWAEAIMEMKNQGLI